MLSEKLFFEIGHQFPFSDRNQVVFYCENLFINET